MRLCQEALERGVFAQAIRPPTVPAGSSRLRLTAMASHTASELRNGGDGVRRGGATRSGWTPRRSPPALPERESTIEELDEREPAYAERGGGELRYTELTVVRRERAREDDEHSMPFDLELDGGRRRRRRAQAAPSSAPTHDQPTEEFNVEQDLEERRSRR